MCVECVVAIGGMVVSFGMETAQGRYGLLSPLLIAAWFIQMGA